MTAGAAARRFRSLHEGATVLRLANAWDAASARLVEETGGRAVATSSAGVAWALGYPDGERLPLQRLLGVVGDLLSAVSIPVSIDLERGYSDDPERVAETVQRLAELGVAGVNLEDAALEPSLFARKLEACRTRLGQAGLDLFLNARTDVFLRGAPRDGDGLAEVVRRARCYRDAGADGLFVPALYDRELVSEIASAVRLPLNVWPAPEQPDIDELATWGVRRVSVGPRLALEALSLVRANMLAFHGRATETTSLTFAQVNALLAQRRLA